MSGFRPFTRQLGAQPGVQLNPLADQTDGVVPDNSDQVGATIARLTRGRIDQPFPTTKGNLVQKTGKAEALRVNALNESKLSAYEGLGKGMSACVVQRMVSENARKLYAVVRLNGATSETADIVDYSVSEQAPTANYSMYLMHHDCFNDGIRILVHADATPVGGTPEPNPVITLRVTDPTGILLHQFTGSLDKNAVNDYGMSNFLPDIIAGQTQALTLVVADGAKVNVNSNAYGRSITGKENWASSETLVCFQEGGTTYSVADQDRWLNALRNTRIPFGYMFTGGNQNTQFLNKWAALADEINIPLKVDLNGKDNPETVIKTRNAIAAESQLVHFNWMPIEADDPLNGGRAVWGAGGLQVGLSCARNARVNGKGFAPKHWPISGALWPVQRANMRQLYTPSEAELSDLARAQINPVLYETYNGGTKVVFTDCLTAAKSLVSFRRLQNVAEMAASIDNAIALAAKEYSQRPMASFIKEMSDFMTKLFEGAQASEWLVPSEGLPGNAAFAFEVAPSEAKPADTVMVNYYTSYDGVARQVFLQQTLVK